MVSIRMYTIAISLDHLIMEFLARLATKDLLQLLLLILVPFEDIKSFALYPFSKILRYLPTVIDKIRINMSYREN